MEMLLTGDPIGAARAYEVGLVNAVVSSDQLVATVQAIAESIAANAPLSVLAAKSTVGLMAEHSLSEAFAEAERIWDPVYRSEDAQEGPAAFRDGRRPQWKGR